eukprot:Hpha_TRINITY_DN15254_c3_g13::TRINITY_DN15254_c3_g13_i1::g.65888::m.65888
MKFGRKMREQAQDVFEDEVIAAAINYKLLKKHIARLKEGGLDGEEGEFESWLNEFQKEVRKFDDYFQEWLKEVQEEIDAAEAGQTGAQELKDLYYRVQELRLFAELNRTGCRKILKKFDKNLPGHDVTQRFAEVLPDLAVARMDGRLTELARRVAEAYKPCDARVAQMELDYHVSCVSDLFAYILSHGSREPPREVDGPPSLASSPSDEAA